MKMNQRGATICSYTN